MDDFDQGNAPDITEGDKLSCRCNLSGPKSGQLAKTTHEVGGFRLLSHTVLFTTQVRRRVCLNYRLLSVRVGVVFIPIGRNNNREEKKEKGGKVDT